MNLEFRPRAGSHWHPSDSAAGRTDVITGTNEEGEASRDPTAGSWGRQVALGNKGRRLVSSVLCERKGGRTQAESGTWV